MEKCRVEVRLCGLPQYPIQKPITAAFTLNAPNQVFSDFKRALLRNFDVNADEFSLLWHLNTEQCHIKRPFKDLYRAANAEWLRHRIVCFHLHRHSGHQKEPGISIAAIKADIGSPVAENDHSGETSTGRDGLDDPDGDRSSVEETIPAPANISKDRQPYAHGSGVPSVTERSEAPTHQQNHASKSTASASQQAPIANPKAVTIKIEWSFDPGDLVDSTSRTPPRFAMRLDSSLPDLRESIRIAVVKTLSSMTEPRFRSLRPGNTIRLEINIEPRAARPRLLDIDDQTYGGRLATLSDFFENPNEHGLRLRAVVRVVVDTSMSDGPAIKKQKTSKAAIVPFDFDSAVRTSRAPNGQDFIRIGEERKTKRPSNMIAVEYPLIAEVDSPHTELLHIWETDGGDFGNDCVGGFDLSKKEVGFKKTYVT